MKTENLSDLLHGSALNIVRSGDFWGRMFWKCNCLLVDVYHVLCIIPLFGYALFGNHLTMHVYGYSQIGVVERLRAPAMRHTWPDIL